MKKLENLLEKVKELEELKYLNENVLREIVTDLNKLKYSYIGKETQKLYLLNLSQNEKYFKLYDEFREVTSALDMLNNEIAEIYKEIKYIWYDLVFEDTMGNAINI